MRPISSGLVGRLLTGQVPVGPVDGANAVFTTEHPFLHNDNFREAVYLSGFRCAEGAGGDYVAVESGGVGTGYDTLVFAHPPLSSDFLVIDYYPSGQ